MKLNFWQIVGGVLIVVALIAIIYREFLAEKQPATPSQPTTLPAVP
ncbi:MAG: hypothetical protein QM754_12965 [Tepidisphaeraceae bacterium]